MAQQIHFIGIGGISLSALAIMLKKQGYKITGSDICQNKETKMLQKNGIEVFIGHSQQNVKGANLVVFSSAIKPDNPEIIFAKNNHIKLISRAELLGVVASSHKKVIAISGTHGKTTTTAMISSILLKANKNPTIHIGANLPIINGNVRVGSKEYFVTEACEYCNSFLTLKSYYAVILNVQKDHMDYFSNLSNLQKSFKNFAKNTNKQGFLIVNNDDKFCRALKTQSQKISFAINSSAHVCAKNLKQNSRQQYSFNLFVLGRNLGRIKLAALGRHNVYNALASITIALLEGVSFCKIKQSLKHFKTCDRRFEKIKNCKAKIIHDYAHHPTEIIASIQTAKQITNKKLIVAFEPHTYSRTQYLWKEFCRCFNGADELVLCPIYAAREKPIEGITSSKLASKIKNTGLITHSVESLTECYDILKQFNKKGNTILILGAGTINTVAEMFKTKTKAKGN